MRWARSAIVAAASAALLLAACSGSSTQPAGQAPEAPFDLAAVARSGGVTGPVAIDTQAELPFFLPGTRTLQWVEIDDELCVVGPVQRRCTPFDDPFDEISFAWNHDDTSVLFNEHWSLFFIEPDIWSFDPTSGVLTNLTDDGQDSMQADDASLDVAPFVGDDGTTYHFRIDRNGPTTLWSVNPVDAAAEMVLDSVEFQVLGGVHRVGADQYLVSGIAIDDPVQVTLLQLDLQMGITRELAVPGIDSPWVVASGEGAVIVADRDLEVTRTSSYQLISFGDDFGSYTSTTIDMTDDPAIRQVPAIAMSADGRNLVIALRAGPSAAVELRGYQLVEGDLVGPLMLAPAGFLEPDAPDSDRGIWGSRTLQRMIWTADNELAVVSDGQVLIFQLNEGQAG